MTEVDDKLELFLRMIQDRIREEQQMELNVLEDEKISKLRKLKEQLEVIGEQELKQTTKAINQKAIELVSRERVRVMQEEMKLRESFIVDIMEGVERRLKTYLESEEYKNLLISSVRKTIEELSLGGGSYCIYLTECDYKRFIQELNTVINEYHISMDIAITGRHIFGGFLIEERNRRYRLDNSLQNKLADIKEYIGLRLDEILN